MNPKFNLYTVASIAIFSGSGRVLAQPASVLISNQSGNPDNSAILELRSSNQGLLIPRVDISDLNLPSPVSSPATGLMVYNTSTSTGVGHYWWNGSLWVRIIGTVDNRLAGNQLSLTGNVIDVIEGAGSGLDADLLDGQNGTYYLDNTDAQTLALSGSTLTIAGGNSVNLAGFSNTDAQTLVLSGNTLSITGGNNVSLAGFVNTDNQTLSHTVSGTNRTINISGGNGTTINVADNDNSSTNELQALSISGSTISLSSGGSVTIPSSADNLGNHSAATTLEMNNNWITGATGISTQGSNSYDKLRVWNSSSYSIGMHSGQSFGYLNDYAMTFTMNTDSDRGFLWRDVGDATNDGAMSLTTDGRLTVKSLTRLQSLSGTGNRPVYADANGTLTTSSADDNTAWTMSANFSHSPDDWCDGCSFGGSMADNADDITQTVNMGFTVTIDGTDYSTVSVCSNGWIAFGSTGSTNLSNGSIPNGFYNGPVIFPYWDDLRDYGSGEYVRWGRVGANGGYVFLIDYSMRQFGNSNRQNFQVQIHQGSGLINVKYRNEMSASTNGQSASIGFQVNNSKGYPIVYNGKVLDDNRDDSEGWSVCPVR